MWAGLSAYADGRLFADPELSAVNPVLAAQIDREFVANTVIVTRDESLLQGA